MVNINFIIIDNIVSPETSFIYAPIGEGGGGREGVKPVRLT